MVLTKLRFIYDQFFFVYMYTLLVCLYNHLHVELITILIKHMDHTNKLRKRVTDPGFVGSVTSFLTKYASVKKQFSLQNYVYHIYVVSDDPITLNVGPPLHMVLTKLRFIYDQSFFIYMYIVLVCLYNHLHVDLITILIRIVDQNLKFMMDSIHFSIFFY